MRRLAVLLLLIPLLLAGCSERPSFRVGYQEGQPISELLANAVAEMLRQSGARSVLTACPDPVACGRQLQAGDIDLLPEYSGSVRAFMRTGMAEEGGVAAARQALEQFGLSATPGLGFEAPYQLLMRAGSAGEAGVASLEELTALQQPTFGVPRGYARQPGDGLFALARRYGVEIAPAQVREIVRPEERIAQLLSGRIDIAVLRAPYVDRNEGVRRLADSLNFYPRYEASVVLGRRAVDQQAFVEDALRPLFGALSAEDVQPLLREQVLRGRDPARLARRLLVNEGILDATGPSVRRPEMTLVYAGGEELEAFSEQALLTLRRAFPERPVNVVSEPDPLEALAEGRASLALVYTSDFFELGSFGSFGGRDPRGEAIAPVGRRPFVALIRRDAFGSDENPLAGAVGTQPAWTAGGQVAARMLTLAGGRPTLHASSGRLVSAVRSGELDAAIVLLDQAARDALATLEGNDVRVEGLSRWLVAPPFFLNEERLPASAIPGALGPVDTLSMQLVLAGPAPRGSTGPVHGGPTSAVATGGLPLPLREAEALAAASDDPEPLDPVLPSFRDRQAAMNAAGAADRGWVETALILAALAFLAWAFHLLVRPQRRL